MILWVHERLIFQAPDYDLDKAMRLVKAKWKPGADLLGLSVPFKVDLGMGKTGVDSGRHRFQWERAQFC